MVMRAPGEPTGSYSFQYRYDSFPGLLHAPRLRNGPRRNATGAETSDWVTGSQWSTDHAKFSLIGDTLTMSQLPDGPHKARAHTHTLCGTARMTSASREETAACSNRSEDSSGFALTLVCSSAGTNAHSGGGPWPVLPSGDRTTTHAI
jgi:hypothetical protein